MKKHFLTGLLILLPLALTIAVVVFIVNFLTQPFIGIVSTLVLKYIPASEISPLIKSPQIIKTVSEIIILISLVIFTFFLGMIARWFFFKSLISFGDAILHRIPVINKVYKTCQEIIKTLFITDKDSFKQVVLVPFPNDDSFVLGLISRESPQACKKATQKDLITVLVPTAPNPTTGYLFLYDRHKITPVEMKTEEAIKFIVSCGVVTPEHPEIHS